jgi:hypothetical protein
MRITKIPVINGDGDIPAKVHRAEQRFLESLKVEASRSGRVRAAQMPKSGSRASIARGRGMGAAFASLSASSQDFDRAASFAGALKQGIHEAHARKEQEVELTQNSDFLRSLGFRGHSDDE